MCLGQRCLALLMVYSWCCCTLPEQNVAVKWRLLSFAIPRFDLSLFLQKLILRVRFYVRLAES